MWGYVAGGRGGGEESCVPTTSSDTRPSGRKVGLSRCTRFRGETEEIDDTVFSLLLGLSDPTFRQV